MSLPDFIVIGAMKSGTTTLAAQLANQNGIFVTNPKEPNYFSNDEVYSKGKDWYARLFLEAQKTDIKGEASTHYTKLPTYPNTVIRMSQVLPKLRIIYVIRNPIQRLISHYIHDWTEGNISTGLDANTIESNETLIDYSRFGFQISPYIEKYGREAILLTSLERLKSERENELKRIARHIGHEGEIKWREDHSKENVSSQRIRKLPFHDFIMDHPFPRTLRHVFVPNSIRKWVVKSRQMHDRPTIPESTNEKLVKVFANDRLLLEQYFPEDPSIGMAYGNLE